MDKTKRPPVDNLLRGISTHHAQTVRDAWRELLEQGEQSVASVRSKLATSKWEEPPEGPLSSYLGILLAVLDELDSDAFRQELERLLKGKLHPINRKTLVFLWKRVMDNPAASIGAGVPVYVSADIENRRTIIKSLERWIRTPGLSLDSVTRIDVIARSDLDYLGKYNIHTSTIVLTWPARRVWGVHRWLQVLLTESVFYHEVGHHVLGHLEGGQVAEQEKKADDYAASMMRKSHPVLTQIFMRVVRPVARAIRRTFAAN